MSRWATVIPVQLREPVASKGANALREPAELECAKWLRESAVCEGTTVVKTLSGFTL